MCLLLLLFLLSIVVIAVANIASIANPATVLMLLLLLLLVQMLSLLLLLLVDSAIGILIVIAFVPRVLLLRFTDFMTLVNAPADSWETIVLQVALVTSNS